MAIGRRAVRRDVRFDIDEKSVTQETFIREGRIVGINSMGTSSPPTRRGTGPIAPDEDEEPRADGES